MITAWPKVGPTTTVLPFGDDDDYLIMTVSLLKYILPDTIIVKHAQNTIPPKDWREYKW